jgi:regulator of protease activity HflC (stomatin/prohibitin superfamily)
MKYIFKLTMVAVLSFTLMACGSKVEVPPAHVGKIMTKDGYQETLIPTSTFRLPSCLTYCDRLVVLDVSDKSYSETLNIFIPQDKLNLGVVVRTTLSVNPKKTTELFNALSPQQVNSDISSIDNGVIYNTYATQIIQAEVREYLSKLSISQIASSNEKINADISVKLNKTLQERTPFVVRYVGVTNITYPKIITDAQENAAERRERIQQEEAQLQISKVTLDRQLQETRMTRAIEKEKADTDAIATLTVAKAEAQAIQIKGEAEANAIRAKTASLRESPQYVDLVKAERWNGTLPTTVMGDAVPMMQLK